jgi:hypothetical protein
MDCIASLTMAGRELCAPTLWPDARWSARPLPFPVADLLQLNAGWPSPRHQIARRLNDACWTGLAAMRMGCSNDALVRSASDSGPDRADYRRSISALRDHRSSHHFVRTQGGPCARGRQPKHVGCRCSRPEGDVAVRQFVGRQPASAAQTTRRALFDRRVHRNYRRARGRRPLARCLDGKTIASLVSGLRLVFVGRQVELFQLAVRRLF